jgi:hypothetical protein
MRVAPIASAAFLVLFSACEESGSRNQPVTEQDSAGLTIVINQLPYPTWHVGETPLVRIGLREG